MSPSLTDNIQQAHLHSLKNGKKRTQSASELAIDILSKQVKVDN